MSLLAALSRLEIYESEVSRVAHKLRERAWTLDSAQQNFLAVAQSPRTLAQQIRASVVSYAYIPEPARMTEGHMGGKVRRIAKFTPWDQVIHGVVARALGDALKESYPKGLYSYRRGRSALMAARDFAAYLRTHVHSRPDPRTRGLFVFRSDIRNYTESIDTQPTARLWRLLDQHWPDYACAPQELRTLVQACIRVSDGGIPMGSPVVPLVANLYLFDVDHSLSAVPGSFYGRFGDDLLFAHPDAAVCHESIAQAGTLVSGLGLEFHPRKTKELFLNAAGRPTSLGFESVQAVDWLGFRIRPPGCISLPPAKMNELLREISARLHRAGDSALPQLMNPNSPWASALSAELLLAVDDRSFLKQLDDETQRLLRIHFLGSPRKSLLRSPAGRAYLKKPRLSWVRARNRGTP